MNDRRLGLLGATSLVGECLLPRLTMAGWRVAAFSRRHVSQEMPGVEWRQLINRHAESGCIASSRKIGEASPAIRPQDSSEIGYWISVAPIWALPQYFELLEACAARRIVAISSTSLFTKRDSSDPTEQAIARQIAEGEEKLRVWAGANDIEWVILRPTLIYGRGRDRNISEIARFISRLGFFPFFGPAEGLRQPVHVEDVADACFAALHAPLAANRAYNISGEEILSYREMVRRVFDALGRRPRSITVPCSVFAVAVTCLRWLPRYRHWSAGMAERMSRDQVFEHSEAAQKLGFRPRPFRLTADDLPP